MNKLEVVEILKFINGGYSRFQLKEDMPTVWYEFLKDEDKDTVWARLKGFMSTSSFEPTVSDLLKPTGTNGVKKKRNPSDEWPDTYPENFNPRELMT